MKKLLHFIALVPVGSDSAGNYTAYFFNKGGGVILPIELSDTHAQYFLQNPKKTTLVPSVYNTFRRTLVSLEACLHSVLIFNHHDDLYYAYLCLNKGEKQVMVNIACADALILAKYFKVNVFVENEVLEECGIKVNEKILRDALRETPDEY